jgi:hypothetical protein
LCSGAGAYEPSQHIGFVAELPEMVFDKSKQRFVPAEAAAAAVPPAAAQGCAAPR